MRARLNPLELARSVNRCWPVLLDLLILISRPALGQTAISPQLQAVQAQAWSAVMGTNHPTSITLNATFTSTEGLLQQTGSAQLTAGSDGSYSINLTRTAGPINESRKVSDGIGACTWTDQDNVVHPSSFLNCLPPAWFFPSLTLLSSATTTTLPAWTPSSYSPDSLGNHLQFQFLLPIASGSQEDPQLLKPFDLVLSSDSQLPQNAVFTIHPDNPGFNADIPVVITYSNYQSISGVMIPFHIQRYVNGNLTFDLAISSAVVQ